MKNLFLPSFIALFLLFSTTSCDSENNNHELEIGAADLPISANEFVAQYFPNATYLLIKKQNTPDSDSSVYDVTLTNNFEIDFDIDGNWIDIEGNHQAIPLELIPKKIATYTVEKYSNQFITSIDIELSHIEVQLSNAIELIFDLQGNFIRIDK